MNSIETVAKNIRLEVMQYAFFHLFPVTVAGTAMIMDIRTAKVDNGWIIFSMSVGLFGKIEEMVAAHDVGKAVNPLSCEGQIEGGVYSNQSISGFNQQFRAK